MRVLNSITLFIKTNIIVVTCGFYIIGCVSNEADKKQATDSTDCVCKKYDRDIDGPPPPPPPAGAIFSADSLQVQIRDSLYPFFAELQVKESDVFVSNSNRILYTIHSHNPFFKFQQDFIDPRPTDCYEELKVLRHEPKGNFNIGIQLGNKFCSWYELYIDDSIYKKTKSENPNGRFDEIVKGNILLIYKKETIKL
jgi:hypothetical protein